MSIEAMKQALEWIEAQPDPRMITAGAVCTALRQAIEQAEKQAALDKKADNARALGLDYEPEQEPVAVWELQEGGWDTIADADWMETLPIGTKLYALGQSK